MSRRLLATIVAGSMAVALTAACLTSSAGASSGRRLADSTATAPATRDVPPGQASSSGLATGDPRRIRRPSIPPTCRRVLAGLSTSTGSFSAQDENNPPDTQRIQAALDA